MSFLTPTISVIIPTLNRKHLIGETINSFLNQTLPPSEIIVVDNNSSDNTVAFLKSEYKNKIIIIENKGINTSPGYARNLGFEIASGKYIQFFDSDDVLTRNKLQNQVLTLEKTGADCVYGPYVQVIKSEQELWEQTDVIMQYKPFGKAGKLLSYMSKGFFTIIPSFLFTKSFLHKVGPWRTDIVAYEDFEYLWRIAQLKPVIAHAPDSCVFYRVHQNQTTLKNFSDAERDFQKYHIFKNLVEKSNGLFINYLLQIQIAKVHKRLSMDGNFKNRVPMYEKDYQFLSMYLRLENKLNRMFSRSDWQIVHGISKNKPLFDKYAGLV